MTLKTISLAAIPVLLVSITSQAVTVEQLNRQVQRMNQRISEQDQRFRVNGYATFGITQSDEAVSYNGVGDELNFQRFSRAGIQMSFNMNPQSSVITQLVARGANDYNANMEWAYYRHQFNDNYSGKIGRIRGPYYMLSEYLDVGYAVPWAQMPAETYGLLDTFANIDGIDITWDGELGDYGLQVQGVYGKTTTDDFIVKDIYSVAATLISDEWSARVATAGAALSTGSGSEGRIINLADQLYGNGTGAKDGSFASISFRYDPGDILLMGEYTLSEVDGVTQDQSSMFVTAGYRFGQWVPHITYGFHESTDDKDRETTIPLATDLAGLGVPYTSSFDFDASGTNEMGELVTLLQSSSQSDATRIGIGVRYDMNAGVALKLQYDLIETDQVGLFDFEGFLGAQAAGNAPDKTNILTFTIDTVF